MPKNQQASTATQTEGSHQKREQVLVRQGGAYQPPSINPSVLQLAIQNPQIARPETVLQLQRLCGNRAVTQALAKANAQVKPSQKAIQPVADKSPQPIPSQIDHLPHTPSSPGISVIQRQGDWDYFMNLGVSLISLPQAWVISNLTRIPDLLEHIFSSVRVFSWLWRGIKIAIGSGDQTVTEWLRDGLLNSLVWAGRLITKALDVVGFGEVMDLVLQLINSSTRRLTAAEIAAAQVVYGDTIPYWKVKVNTQQRPITNLYNIIAGRMIATTFFHTIELVPPYDQDLNNIVHELGHVKQYETVGLQYIPESICVGLQAHGYDYGAKNLVTNNLSTFNREQQCRISEHYWALYSTDSIQAAFGLVPSLGQVGLRAAIRKMRQANGGMAGMTGREVAIAMYQPRIMEFRAGNI